MESTSFAENMETLQGRCISCGFFAKHAAPGIGDSTYFEAELSERDSGNVFEHTPHGFARMIVAPICFRNEVALPREVKQEQESAKGTLEGAVRAILLKDRACPQWFRYQPGLSPRDHLGGLAMQETEQRQYKFQEDMEKRRRQWEQQLEHDRRRFEIKVTALLAIITAAGVITPIVVAVLFR